VSRTGLEVGAAVAVGDGEVELAAGDGEVELAAGDEPQADARTAVTASARISAVAFIVLQP